MVAEPVRILGSSCPGVRKVISIPESRSAWLESYLGKGRYKGPGRQDVEVRKSEIFILLKCAGRGLLGPATGFMSEPVLACWVKLEFYMSGYRCHVFFEGI